MAKKASKEMLDKLGVEYGALRGPGNEAALQKKTVEIWTLVYQIYTSARQQEVLADIFLNEWAQYDPQKSKLSSYFDFRVDHRQKDAYRAEAAKTKHLAPEVPGSGDEEPTELRIERVGDTGAAVGADLEDLEQTDATLLNWIGIILHLPEKLRGRANNPKRQKYFCMFFTDQVTEYIRRDEAGTYARCRKHERDIMQAIRKPFMDYYLVEDCSTVNEIACSHLKKHGEMVENQPMEEVRQPLPYDIYCAYLKRVENETVTPPALSMQLTAYREFMKGELC